MGVNLTGMASGLDTDSIIQQLMAVEQQSVTQVQMKQVKVQAHKDALTALQTKMNAVKTAASALSDSSAWTTSQTTTSSDPTKVGAQLISGAGVGGHTIQVDKLASSAQHGFSYAPSASAGSLTFYYGTDPNASTASKVTIQVSANEKPADIATAINANQNSPVYAAVVNDGTADRLVFSARKSGQSSDFTVDTSGMAADAAMSEISTYSRTGTALNAQYKIDDDPTEHSSESNTIDNAIPGVRLTLTGTTTSPVSVSTTQSAIDQKGITTKVQALVDAYNSFIDLANTDISEKSVPNATTSDDLQKGTLFGDTSVLSMMSSLKSQMTQFVSGLGLKSLADIGITVPAATGGATTDDAKEGKLTFDSSKLTTALTADWTQVRDLFSGKGTTKGFSSLISSYVDSQAGSNGMITNEMTSDDSSIKDFNDQIDDLNSKMNDEQTRMKAQFAAMETALSQSQSQQAWLTSQISSL
jgi:flagellar hook-associated protein 2